MSDSVPIAGEEPGVSNWLKTRDVARALGVTQRHVTNLLKRRELAGHKFGKHWRVSRLALDDYIRATSNIPAGDEPEPAEGQLRFVVEEVKDE